jgi:hypothetical protein
MLIDRAESGSGSASFAAMYRSTKSNLNVRGPGLGSPGRAFFNGECAATNNESGAPKERGPALIDFRSLLCLPMVASEVAPVLGEPNLPPGPCASCYKLGRIHTGTDATVVPSGG